MILQYLLFLLYFIFSGYWVLNMRFVRSSGLSSANLISLFILKITAGVLIGWISTNWYAQGNDYWTLNREGWLEHQSLLNDPKKFFTDIFQSPYNDKYSGFFNSVGSYWNDLKNNIIIKILALLNFLSRGNYYINSIFFNAFSFVGTIALLKVFMHISDRNKKAAIAGCFLIPTTLYFSSGIHKDLVVFTMLCFYVYALFFLMKKSFNFKRFCFFMISAIILLLMRNIVLLLLIPPSVFLYLHYKRKWKTTNTFIAVFSLTVVTFFSLHFTKADPLKLLVQKQQDFLDLGNAYTQLPLIKLEPSFSSVATATPLALNHAILRPYPWEYPGHFLMVVGIELCFIYILFLLSIIKKKGNSDKAFIIFCLWFGLSMIILSGYIVPNLGSLVRYRSLYLPFIITPVLFRIFRSKGI